MGGFNSFGQPPTDLAILVAITITLLEGRELRVRRSRFTRQTYDRSAFPDVVNAFLLRQCSITVHRGIDQQWTDNKVDSTFASLRIAIPVEFLLNR